MCTYLTSVTLAVFEGASAVITRHVPTATHDVVNVLAQLRSSGAFFTSSEAELGCRHEVLSGQISGCQTGPDT